MRFALSALLVLLPQALVAIGAEPSSITPAAYVQPESSSANSQALDRIRKIVFSQGDDARALANLVQLTRDLPAETTAQLYYDVAHEYLRSAQYNQAANVLQQVLNQHIAQPIAADAALTLAQLYSSSEVHQAVGERTAAGEDTLQSFCKYAQHVVNLAAHQNPILNEHSALTFERAVVARLSGNPKAALGRLTKLKHNAAAEPWRSRARAEQWLSNNRKDEPPLPVVVCSSTNERPHLDGMLSEPMWQTEGMVRFAYDDEFLYLAISCPKELRHSYEPDSRPRAHDADLSEHDHVRLRLDVDRDYATCYEFAVDSRGWTVEQCWHDTSWNPQWFVAAGATETHWTSEIAIAWKYLGGSPRLRSGAAWAVAWQHILPDSEEPSPPNEDFQLLLFE